MTDRDGKRWAIRLLLGVGAALVVGGVGDAIRVRFLHLEKHAYYVFGHWLEMTWQVHVPLIALGLVAVILAWSISPRR